MVYGLKLYSRLTKTSATSYRGKAQVYTTTAPGNIVSEKTEVDICMYCRGHHKTYHCEKFLLNLKRSGKLWWTIAYVSCVCAQATYVHVATRSWSARKIRCWNKTAHHTLLHPPEDFYQRRNYTEDMGENFPERQTCNGPVGVVETEERVETVYTRHARTKNEAQT